MTQTLGVSVSDGVSVGEILGRLSGIRLDIGCGRNKQPGWVGIDFQPLPGVDIVHDLTLYPWPLPDECATVAMASHVVEHIPPFPVDARLSGLVDLLISKGVLTAQEVFAAIGNYRPGPQFIAFMNEVWRVLKPGAQFAIMAPHGWSEGFLQDPTHCNAMNRNRFAYFVKSHEFYQFYTPKPWIVENLYWDPSTNIEAVLRKDAE